VAFVVVLFLIEVSAARVDPRVSASSAANFRPSVIFLPLIFLSCFFLRAFAPLREAYFIGSEDSWFAASDALACGMPAEASFFSRATWAFLGASTTSVTPRVTLTVAGPEMAIPSPRLRLIFRRAMNASSSWISDAIFGKKICLGR
jgi:hypothetical protein